MSILRKPYEISLWEDEWIAAAGSNPAHFQEKRILTIGSDKMEYQGRAIEPNLVRKTNGEVSFSFKMYYQFVDTVTGEAVDNPFTNYIANESKIKLQYNGEWFDLLVKNINKDSTTKSYIYQLVDQHMTELSKNGFDVELDSKLFNNLGTAQDLGNKVLKDTDWTVESEKIVQTQDEALVMLKLPSNLSTYTIYQIDDSALSTNGATYSSISNTDKSAMAGKEIYAFYSACSGDKPYRFQFIHKKTTIIDSEGETNYVYDSFKTFSDRIIDEQKCQYFIDGITEWEKSGNFVIPKNFTADARETDLDEVDNDTLISALYRGRRYVYTQTSEYHAGLDMYLEKYTGAATDTKDTYFEYVTTEEEWESWGKLGKKSTWSYYADGHEPEDEKIFPVGTIIKAKNSEASYKPIYLLVTNSLIESEAESGGSWYSYEAIVIDSNSMPYYKYTKTNYVTPNLIQNVVNNAEFKGTSGWKGSKYIDSSATGNSNIYFRPITSYKDGKKNPASYTRKQWETYTTPYAWIDTWTVGTENGVDAGKRLAVGEYFYFTDAVISDENNQPIYPLFQALENAGDLWTAISMGYTTAKSTIRALDTYDKNKTLIIRDDRSQSKWDTDFALSSDKYDIGWPSGADTTSPRVKAGECFYLTNCSILAEDGTKTTIYPYLKAQKDQSLSDGTVEVKPLGYLYAPDAIITRQPLSSPEFSATVETISMKEDKSKNTLVSAIDEMLKGETVIGNSDYKPYLLCGNLHKIIQVNTSSKDTEIIGQKTIINNGTSNTIAFQQGIVKNEKYRFVLDASLIRKETTYGDTTTTTYSTSWTGKPTVTLDMKIAKHEYKSDLNGFSLSDYDAGEFSESVLFVSENNSLSDTALSLNLEALGTVDGKSMKEANYQLVLNFSNVPNPSVDQTNKKIYEYYILIKKIQFYKLYTKKDGTSYYSLEDIISTENISYNIEEKYFPVIANDNRKLEDIAYFAPVGTSFIPILTTNGEKKSSVNVKESNYFNAIQAIAETFECWPQITVFHDDSGNIGTKKIKFCNYIGQDNYVGFKYGVNSKDIKRTLDSNQIVSKLIVKANSNEYAPNGFCSIARAPANDTKDNVIYNFGYYANQKLIDALTLQRDLYIAETDGTTHLTNGLDVTTEIAEVDIDDYLSCCSGYYPKMRLINAQLESLSKLISENSAPLNEEIAKHDTYKAMYESATADLAEQQSRFYKLAGFAYNNIPATEKENVLKSTTLYPILQTIAELASTEQDAKSKYQTALSNKTSYETVLSGLEIKYDNALFLKATLNKLFYTRYSRFIQEGTWIDESYIDESLYYNDALSVSYNSSMPKVTYSMSVLSLAGLPGYELFDFKVGDQTFVEDVEFFGYDTQGNPIREKITITETSENLDDPTKNTIKIRNYENQFEDLFQRITATVQSVQYTEGSYKKASELANADAAHKFSFLNGALSAAEARIGNANNTVVVDTSGGTGITITNKNNTEEALRLTSGAILLKGTNPENGQKIWKTGLTAEGISASLVTAGTINTSEISIMNGSEPTFRWDTHGITAYDFDNSVSNTSFTINKNKGIRFDRFGIYGYSGIDGETWKPTGINSGVNSIEDRSTFYLTWEGLKVTTENSIVRIGKHTSLSNPDVISVTSGATKTFSVDSLGNVLLNGHIDAKTGTIGPLNIYNGSNVTIIDSPVDGAWNYKVKSTQTSTQKAYWDTSDSSAPAICIENGECGNSGTDEYYVALKQSLQLEKLKTYKLSFEVKGTSQKAPEIYLTSGKNTLFKQSCDVSASYHLEEFTFKLGSLASDGVNECTLRFDNNGKQNSADPKAVLWIKNVKLEEIGSPLGLFMYDDTGIKDDSHLIFKVGKNSEGANELIMKGHIEAISGKIGGWTLDKNANLPALTNADEASKTGYHLMAGTFGKQHSIHLYTAFWGAYTGDEQTDWNANPSIANHTDDSWRLTIGSSFGVNSSGILYTSGANIGGTLSATYLYAGEADGSGNIFKAGNSKADKRTFYTRIMMSYPKGITGTDGYTTYTSQGYIPAGYEVASYSEKVQGWTISVSNGGVEATIKTNTPITKPPTVKLQVKEKEPRSYALKISSDNSIYVPVYNTSSGKYDDVDLTSLIAQLSLQL